MSSLDLATWATILGTWAAVVGTLAFAYWQLRQAQRLHSSTTLLDLRERFFSVRMRESRRELSRWLLASERGPEPDNWEVGMFFELMGSLTRTRVLDRRMVWHAFGSWITAYYAFLRHPDDLLGKWRAETHDPSIFADFEWLALEMTALDSRGRPSPDRGGDPLEDERNALENETHLRPAGGPE